MGEKAPRQGHGRLTLIRVRPALGERVIDAGLEIDERAADFALRRSKRTRLCPRADERRQAEAPGADVRHRRSCTQQTRTILSLMKDLAIDPIFGDEAQALTTKVFRREIVHGARSALLQPLAAACRFGLS
jgi:hypothetical protein